MSHGSVGSPRLVIATAPIAQPLQTIQTLCAPALSRPRTHGARSHILRFHPSWLPLHQRFLVCLTSGLRPCLADVVANKHSHGDMNSVKPVGTLRIPQMLDVVKDEAGVLHCMDDAGCVRAEARWS